MRAWSSHCSVILYCPFWLRKPCSGGSRGWSVRGTTAIVSLSRLIWKLCSLAATVTILRAWMIDLATRTITAAVLRPATKAVDAALLLARALTPEPMRPGWPDALRMSRSVLPHRLLAGTDQRLQHAAARPVIVPETIVCDHGMVYMSQTFRNACRAMGISIQPTHRGSPWEKGTAGTSFNSAGTLFAQYVAGYVGNSVEHRGEHADQEAAWPVVELQELLDEWIVAVFSDRFKINICSGLLFHVTDMSVT